MRGQGEMGWPYSAGAECPWPCTNPRPLLHATSHNRKSCNPPQQQALIYPLELVRTRLAVCPSGTYGGIFDCAGKVLRQEGVRAFYRGIVPSMIGILPYAGVDIAAFELLKERLLDEVGGGGRGGVGFVHRGRREGGG